MAARGRPATGSASWNEARGCWEARVTAHGEREPIPMPGIAREDVEGARAFAKLVSDRKRGTTPAAVAAIAAPRPAGDSCDQWVAKWFQARKDRGQSSVDHDRYRWANWATPRFGAKHPTEVTRADIEDLRDALDVAIRAYAKAGRGEGRISAKTGANTWTVVTAAFREMCGTKDRAMRVLASNPVEGVQAPDRGKRKKKCFVYPSEFSKLIACVDVPLAWRQLYAIACFTALRPGELRALVWADVDLDHSTINVTKAYDTNAHRVKSTKTGETRTVPIEANLLPLLAEMKRGGRRRMRLCR